MGQTKEGAIRCAAVKLGITPEEYAARTASGLKHCGKCRTWIPATAFGRDVSRHDGLSAKCQGCCLKKIRKSLKGRVSTFKGKKHTAEAKEKMRLARLGKPGPGKGQKRPLEVRLKISQSNRKNALRGPACPAYRDGRNAERRGLRETPEYKQWRFDVYVRDRFSCQLCGDCRGGNLNAHHILAFATYPEYRLVLANGITVCERCHERLHYKPDSVRNRKRRTTLIPKLKLFQRKEG